MAGWLREHAKTLRETWRSFRTHGGPLLSAAISFYSLLALAPLLVIAVAAATAVLGEDAARGELAHQLESGFSPGAAAFISDVVERANRRTDRAGIAAAVSVVFLLYASQRLFAALHSALNVVWGVRPNRKVALRRKAWRWLRRRLLALGMVVIYAVAVLFFLVAKSVLAYGNHALGEVVTEAETLHVIEFLLSVTVVTFVVAIAYRILPDVALSWRAILPGALVTSFMLAVGSLLIGLYLGYKAPESTYGAAGAVVLLMLWVYYAAQVFFLGAELTAIHARKRGYGATPLPHAVRVVTEDLPPLAGDPES